MDLWNKSESILFFDPGILNKRVNLQLGVMGEIFANSTNMLERGVSVWGASDAKEFPRKSGDVTINILLGIKTLAMHLNGKI